MSSDLSQREKSDRRFTLLSAGVGVFIALGVSRDWSGWGGFFASMLLVAVCGFLAALTSAMVLSRRKKREPK